MEPHHLLDQQPSLELPETEEGMASLRLIEPISSLHLTPFAVKAVKAIKETVGDLAAYVFEEGSDCRGLGQSHLEEIRLKLEEFVGHPPYRKSANIDLSSLLRIGLSAVEPPHKAIIVSMCCLQPLVPLTPQETREAEIALSKDGKRKFLTIIQTVRPKASEKLLPILNTIYDRYVQPWICRREGMAHEDEIYQFLFERSTISDHALFDRGVHLIFLLTGNRLLVSNSATNVKGQLWTSSPQKLEQALSILRDAEMLTRKGAEKIDLQGLAKAITKCLLDGWEDISPPTIERLLFWHYAHKQSLIGQADS
jgi:hypothetical protein